MITYNAWGTTDDATGATTAAVVIQFCGEWVNVSDLRTRAAVAEAVDEAMKEKEPPASEVGCGMTEEDARCLSGLHDRAARLRLDAARGRTRPGAGWLKLRQRTGAKG